MDSADFPLIETKEFEPADILHKDKQVVRYHNLISQQESYYQVVYHNPISQEIY